MLKRVARTPNQAYTLPLFPSPDADPSDSGTPAPRRAGTAIKAADLAVEVYSSAQVHALALTAAAAQTPTPRERWALRRLAALEGERKALAAELLHTVWQVTIGPRPDVAHVWDRRGAAPQGYPPGLDGSHDQHVA